MKLNRSLLSISGLSRAACSTLLASAPLFHAGLGALFAAEQLPVLVVPASEATLNLAIPLSPGARLNSARAWQLREADHPATVVPVELAPAVARDGLPEKEARQVLASVPPRTSAKEARRFQMEPVEAAASGATAFRFSEVSGKSLGLWEGNRPVLVYNHGILSKEGVPADRNRSTYIHPIYGLEGEVLTDDFPKDHYHHRGLFWAWPHVSLGEKHYDLWMIQGIHQKFERWLARQAGPAAAIFGVENGWFVGEKKVVQERVWLRVYPAAGGEQSLDLEFVWIPIDQPLTLAGAEGKSYGGLTLRFAPRTQTVITTPAGSQGDDAYMTRLPWADLTAQFAGASQPSGAAIFIGPDHPDYPPSWLTRHYGVLCVGWPGVQPATFKPGEAIHGRYRIWIHRGAAGGAALAQAYEAYKSPAKVTVSLASAAEPQDKPTALALRSELKPDRVSVYAGEKLFTEYLFLSDSKYPYFYPVNGPRTGQSVTTRNTEPYPHHSSLFFGCDRVNGGNYWQEGLERGRIVSKDVRLVRASGDQVVIEQDCRWERPGADSPFRDHRTIAISAPSPDLRYIDFDVTLKAETDVRIEKTNHSLFAARVTPDLAVTGGGTLVNAQGDQGEKATFGRPSPWADYQGTRHGETEGIAIFCHPGDRWYPSPWFTRDYGFFSPTPFNWLEKGYLELAKGEKLRLRYRVVVHGGALSQADLQSQFECWSKP